MAWLGKTQACHCRFSSLTVLNAWLAVSSGSLANHRDGQVLNFFNCWYWVGSLMLSYKITLLSILDKSKSNGYKATCFHKLWNPCQRMGLPGNVYVRHKTGLDRFFIFFSVLLTLLLFLEHLRTHIYSFIYLFIHSFIFYLCILCFSIFLGNYLFATSRYFPNSNSRFLNFWYLVIKYILS